VNLSVGKYRALLADDVAPPPERDGDKNLSPQSAGISHPRGEGKKWRVRFVRICFKVLSLERFLDRPLFIAGSLQRR
jgi:hypothetical protein